MAKENLNSGFRVASQNPLDEGKYFKTFLELTSFGEDNIRIFEMFEGMDMYCAETDSTYRWLDINKVGTKNDNYTKVGQAILYPPNVVANGINYSNRQFALHKVNVLSYSDVNSKIEKSMEDIVEDMTAYKKSMEEYLAQEKKITEEYVEGKLTEANASLIIKLNNEKEEYLKQLRETSELLTKDVEDLKGDTQKDLTELKGEIDKLTTAIDNIPTDTILNEVQLDSLRNMLGRVTDRYLDIKYRINVARKDAFLPKDQLPVLAELDYKNDTAYNNIKVVLDRVIASKFVTEDDRKEIELKTNEYNIVIVEINTSLLAIYDMIATAINKEIDDKIKESIQEVEFLIEYSLDGISWHYPYQSNDKYMRQKNGSQGDWSGAILIKGEDGKDGVDGSDGTNGQPGKYRDYQFAVNNSMTDPPSTGWADVPPTNIPVTSYLWQRYGDVIPPKTKPDTWIHLRITGPKGADGISGDTAIISDTEPSQPLKDGQRWINTSVSPIEEYVWNKGIWLLIGVSATTITKEIKDANDALKKTMDDALEDGIISNNEALAISTNISTLKSVKTTLDLQYTKIYNNALLVNASKVSLKADKDAFDIKHSELLAICNTIAGQSTVTAAQKTEYNQKQTAYDTALTKLSKNLDKCNDEILAALLKEVDDKANTALLNAANALAIAEASREKINFLTVSTDPNIGLITGSTLIVGDATGGNAFISGVTDVPDHKSIRIGVGIGGYANKNSLPFRVLEDGQMFSSSGEIGGYRITTDGIGKTEGANSVDMSSKNSSITIATDYNYGTVLEPDRKNEVRKREFKVHASSIKNGAWSEGSAIQTVVSYFTGDHNPTRACITLANMEYEGNTVGNKYEFPEYVLNNDIKFEYTSGGQQDQAIYDDIAKKVHLSKEAGYCIALEVLTGNVQGQPMPVELSVSNNYVQYIDYVRPILRGFVKDVVSINDMGTNNTLTNRLYTMLARGASDGIGELIIDNSTMTGISQNIILNFRRRDFERNLIPAGAEFRLYVTNHMTYEIMVDTDTTDPFDINVNPFRIPKGQSIITFVSFYNNRLAVYVTKGV